ncbi:hypothetical protein C5167_036799 [Papaver somniferum]|uniref:Polygalacturonase n=1 Tax=Papaver somniferum TaxID=3469 RepID=A0A4Y7I7Q7_PAPSO|nr:hypothetical protein C5167_036799 [Papaver somniferum]
MGTMLQFVIILVFSYHSCYGSSLEDPLYSTTYYDVDDEISSVYNHAYPTYLETVGELNRDDFFPVNELADDDFGANRNGHRIDANEAFEKSWKEACSSSTGAVLILVPSNKIYLLKPIKFSGACKSPITMMVYGTIDASTDRADYRRDSRHWILFQNVQNLKIEGGGTFNGKGDIWWKNSCKTDKSRALTFYQCQNLKVKNLRTRHSQQIHTSFEKCLDVEAINLLISAPGLSPNTDGIHVGNTRKMQIRNCIIRTARLTGTTNGVRIKTWQGGKGKANNIVFQNILMQNVTNPIIINQNYCDQADPCNEQESVVHVSSVVYKNVQGTRDTAAAVKLDCSKSFPCSVVVLQDINLVRAGETQAKALCNNVKFDQLGKVFPKCP